MSHRGITKVETHILHLIQVIQLNNYVFLICNHIELFSRLRIILYNLQRILKLKQISLLTTRCLRHKATAFNDSSHNEQRTQSYYRDDFSKCVS